MTQFFVKYYEIFKYIIFGVLTTLINLLVFFVFNVSFEINYLISNFFAWVISVVFAFYANKYFVFKASSQGRKASVKEFLLFVWFRVFSGIVDMCAMYIFVEYLKLDEFITKIMIQITVVILNYIFSKLVIFKKSD